MKISSDPLQGVDFNAAGCAVCTVDISGAGRLHSHPMQCHNSTGEQTKRSRDATFEVKVHHQRVRILEAPNFER